MSHPPKNAPHSSAGVSPHPNQADLAALAQQFHEATQALTVLCQQQPMPEGVPPKCCHGQKHTEEGETRCYYYSPSALQHERDLLKYYHAQNLPDLLEETHLRLVGLVKLMVSVHADVRVKGQVINSLGCLLEQASALVLRMKHLYARVQRVEQPVSAVEPH